MPDATPAQATSFMMKIVCESNMNKTFGGNSDKLHSYVLTMNYACEAPNPPTNQRNKAKMAI